MWGVGEESNHQPGGEEGLPRGKQRQTTSQHCHPQGDFLPIEYPVREDIPATAHRRLALLKTIRLLRALKVIDWEQK